MDENTKEPAYIYDSNDDCTVKHSNCRKDVDTRNKGDANYIFDDEDEDWSKPNTNPVPGNGLRQSRRVMQQLKANERDDLQQIVMRAAKETAEVPRLQVTDTVSSQGYAAAK